MLFTNICNLILLCFSPLSVVEKKYQIFCNKILTKMKIIYGKNSIKENKASQNKIEVNIKNTIIINKEENNLTIKNKNSKQILIKKKENKFKIIDNNINDSNINNLQKKEENASKSMLINNNVNININKELNENDDSNNMNKKYLEELKAENNSKYYIEIVVQYITYKKRKKYLSEKEIQNLPYKYALQIDNRDKSIYYYSLLKEKNKIISIFLNRDDFNIVIVKISLFIFSFNLSFTINALFFNDEAIYQINQDNGTFNLSNQILRVLYSTIISTAISFIVEFFALTHNNIIEIRNYKSFDDGKIFSEKLIKKLKIKFVAFYVINIVLNLFFLLYNFFLCNIFYYSNDYD